MYVCVVVEGVLMFYAVMTGGACRGVECGVFNGVGIWMVEAWGVKAMH